MRIDQPDVRCPKCNWLIPDNEQRGDPSGKKLSLLACPECAKLALPAKKKKTYTAAERAEGQASFGSPDLHYMAPQKHSKAMRFTVSIEPDKDPSSIFFCAYVCDGPNVKGTNLMRELRGKARPRSSSQAIDRSREILEGRFIGYAVEIEFVVTERPDVPVADKPHA